MKFTFIGVGSQFSSMDQYQSNIVVTARGGEKLLIDCGSDARFALAESGMRPTDLDAVYISHLHGDHIGGLEWLALSTYFSPQPKRLTLFCEERTMASLWDHSLQGGLHSIQAQEMELADYFLPQPIADGGSFTWREIRFTLRRMPHIVNSAGCHDSYGLIVEDGTSRVFITTDTQFVPEAIEEIAGGVEMIFHDCETAPFKTTVHAHYEQLRTLPNHVKNKIWLYHYQANPPFRATEDGFQGFVAKGQEFQIP